MRGPSEEEPKVFVIQDDFASLAKASVAEPALRADFFFAALGAGRAGGSGHAGNVGDGALFCIGNCGERGALNLVYFLKATAPASRRE